MFRLYLEYARLVSPDRDNGKMVRFPAHTRELKRGGRLINRTLYSRASMLLVEMRGLLRGFMLRKGLFLMLPINRDE